MIPTITVQAWAIFPAGDRLPVLAIDAGRCQAFVDQCRWIDLGTQPDGSCIHIEFDAEKENRT